MTWIRNNLATFMLFAFIVLTILLFATGKLRWSSREIRSSAESGSAEHGEAAEKKVKGGKVVLDAEDFKASGVVVAAVQTSSVGETLEAPGEVQSIQTRLAQITPAIPGVVRAIHRLAGDLVTRGTALCTIESAELGAARAELESALAERDVTQRNYERWKQLYEKGLRSQTELWAEEADYNKARLRVEAAAARLRALGLEPDTSSKDRLGLNNRYELRSPLSGVVLQQQLTVGQNVEQKDVLFTVADLSYVWVTAAVYEKDLAGLHRGTSAIIHLQSQSSEPMSLEGRVEYVGQQADLQTRTVSVRITVINRKEPGNGRGYVLRPGMFATVRFITGRRPNALTLPADAVQDLSGESIVFVQVGGAQNSHDGETNSGGKNGKKDEGRIYVFEPRVVTLGNSDGKLTEIVKGVQRGDQVVVHNAYLLKSELEKEKIGEED